MQTNVIAAAAVSGLLFIATACQTTATQADVVDWSVAKFQGYSQTGNNTAPTTPTSYTFFAQLAGAPGDFGSGAGDVTFEDNTAFGTVNMNPLNDFGSGPSDWEFEQEFATLSALNAAFPNGNDYGIETAGGALGDFTESISYNHNFFSLVPFLTGNSFNDLQSMNATQDLTVNWNTPPTGADNGYFLSILNSTTQATVFETSAFDTTDTSTLISGNTLAPGTGYELLLTFAETTPDVLDGLPDGFLTGSGLTGIANETSVTFTTNGVPEPSSTFFILGVVTILGCRRRRAIVD